MVIVKSNGKRLLVYGVVLFAMLTGILVAVCLRHRPSNGKPSAEIQLKLQQLDRFCMATRDAVRQDRRALEEGSAAEVAETLRRFYEGHVMYHNSQSIMMCLPEDAQIAFPSMCWIAEDRRCIAEFARGIERQLKMGAQ